MATRERRAHDRAERHRLIIDTARSIAESDGWDAVTTRRLADTISYSQPVLYSHFAGKDAIVAAVAVQGFAEMATRLRTARTSTDDARASVLAVAQAYAEFSAEHPAVFDAMFSAPSVLRFADETTPTPLLDAFAEIRSAVTALADGRDPELLTEVFWSAVHGQVILGRATRLRPDLTVERLTMAVRSLV
ncbi:TetR/AcrR family transcriptional regulator [Williamsia sterculiae]|uniref:TetR/AcrR family transcriptional regulator n=1 Tax=Williamsia sterculiae TaxID=1344003 RepID=UPI0009703394|nr:TetR/AcrR family transcriptional regulator [Williamsia sterculiae]